MRSNNRKLMFILFLIIFSCTAGNYNLRYKDVEPPDVEKKPEYTIIHGDTLKDDYRWLRDKLNPKVMDYIERENSYTDRMFSFTKELQDTLYNEYISRIKEDDMSLPIKVDRYYYYSKTEKGKDYSIYCRRKDSMSSEEEVLIDVNELAKGHKYFDFSMMKLSTNHDLIAYCVDTIGAERFTLFIKRISSNRYFSEKIDNVDDFVWANDNKTIFYTVTNDINFPYRVYKHKLNTSPMNDIFVYEEKDPTYYLWLSKTKSRKYIIMGTDSKTTSERYILDASKPDSDFILFQERTKDVEYSIEHFGNKFFILTNLNAKNYRLMETPVTNTGIDSWRDIIAPREKITLERFEVFSKYLAVQERINGLVNLKVIDMSSGDSHNIKFDEPAYSCWINEQTTLNTDSLIYGYTSFLQPETYYKYNMNTKKRKTIKTREVYGYDKDKYVSERIFAEADDGVKIPISLMYLKDIKKDNSNPVFLYSYGAYGDIGDAYFSSSRLSLVNRGFVYAYAHVRGGGEMGKYWHDQGKFLFKRNTFTDFIACTEHLINEDYTKKDLIAVQGGSAGGLLIGAVVNMRPDLYQAAVANVPFVDVMNTMLDPSIPLTVYEYEEWGNPNDKVYYDYMKSYSPYDNVKKQNYPNMLIIGGLNDTRVGFWEPLKWTAKLRDFKTDNNLLMLRMLGAGHAGSSGRYSYYEELAFEHAFVLEMIKKSSNNFDSQ